MVGSRWQCVANGGAVFPGNVIAEEKVDVPIEKRKDGA